MKSIKVLLLSLLILSQSAQAGYLSYSDYMDEAAQIINNAQMSHGVAYKLGGSAVSDECVVFMNKEMFLGENGRNIFETFVKNTSTFPKMTDGGNLVKYCPKYSRMDLSQKAMVWVMVLTMMAHFESSCNIKAQAKGPNGTAKGYYQLHLGKEQNYDYAMNICQKNASKNSHQSSKCAMAMVEMQMARENGNLFSPKSYWDVLRPNGAARKADDIQRALGQSTLCNPRVI